MKHLLIISFLTLSTILHAQNKHNYVHFNKLIEVENTAYVIATVEDRGKMSSTKAQYLLFIHTESGETQQIDFPKDAYVHKMEQVRIDGLGINRIIISARTIDLNEKRGIGWEDPMQVLVLSVDGKEKVQLTEDSFFTRAWVVNKETGKIVITGYYDTNGNNKYDKTDKGEILIYDLKSLELVSRI